MALKTFKPYTKSTSRNNLLLLGKVSGKVNPSNHLQLAKNLHREEIILDELLQEEEDPDINKNIVK